MNIPANRHLLSLRIRPLYRLCFIRSVILTIAVCISLVAVPWEVQAAIIRNPANGHYYALSSDFGLPNMTWVNANAAVAGLNHLGLRSHLATITSVEESRFVAQNFGALPAWIGLFQTAGAAEPGQDSQGAGAGWQWVTSEPFYRSTTNTAAD